MDDILEQTLKRLKKTWSEVSQMARGENGELSFHPDLNDDDQKRLHDLIQRCLDAPSGEVSARGLAARIGHSYMSLSQVGRARFLRLLASDFDVDEELIRVSIIAYLEPSDPSQLANLRRRLKRDLEAPRMRLLTQFNALPEGVKFLVDMREELLRFDLSDAPELRGLERDLKQLLGSWFDIGFLRLEQITWQSPAALLEKLIEYEAVHEIASWDDLKNRLDTDRRLFAFFHPNMPNEPLIFVQVALVDGLAGNIQELLDADAPIVNSQDADTAIFYSISNAQQGLAGISFGNYLIKQVVAELKKEFSHLKRFATLSPIPNLMHWIADYLSNTNDFTLTKIEQKLIEEVAALHQLEPNVNALLGVENWHKKKDIAEALESPLKRICCQYLISKKPESKKVQNPVAHFHLSNGAIVQRVNWLADTSEKGLVRSAGMMVNYLYKLESINANSEGYSHSGEIAMSSNIKGQL